MTAASTQIEVAGTLLLGCADACRNLGIIADPRIDKLSRDVTPDKWYPLQLFTEIEALVFEHYRRPDIILEHIGWMMMAMWYEYGPGNEIIDGGLDFLRFQSGAQGFLSVMRGPDDQLGRFELVDLNAGEGQARIHSSTPFNRDMERGIIIGGMTAPGDIDYLSVESEPGKDDFVVSFHVASTQMNQLLRSLAENETPSVLAPEEIAALLWKHRGLQKEMARQRAFWAATRENMLVTYRRLDQAAAELLQASFRAASDGIVVVDLAGLIMHANARFASLWRQSPPRIGTDLFQFLERERDQLVAPDDLITRITSAAASNEDTRDEIELTDGRIFACISNPLMKDGQLSGRVWNFRDISRQKEAEAAQKKSEAYLSLIIDAMPSVLIGVDREERVTFWNHEAARICEVTRAAALGRHLTAVFPRFEKHMEALRLSILEGKPRFEAKVPGFMEDRTIYEDLTIYPLGPAGESGAVIRLDDTTERTRLEEMIIQSEKMLSVGGLAAGMAHEINNPLAGMLQNAQVLNQRLNLDRKQGRTMAQAHALDCTHLAAYLEEAGAVERLQAITTAGTHAARIVRNMLSFSRKSEDLFEWHTVTELLDTTVELVGSDYDLKKHYDFRKIVITREYEAALPEMYCDASKLQQVFFNILKNGAEAMHGTEARPATPEFVLRLKRDSDHIRIEIQDNGPGMDRMVAKRVFEPFFTTKEGSAGTGIGLSVSYFIVTENHGGTLEVISDKGSGTKFIIRLPLNPPDAAGKADTAPE